MQICQYVNIRYPSQSNNRHNGPTVRYTYLVTNLFIYGANSVMQVLILYNTTTTIAIYRYWFYGYSLFKVFIHHFCSSFAIQGAWDKVNNIILLVLPPSSWSDGSMSIAVVQLLVAWSTFLFWIFVKAHISMLQQIDISIILIHICISHGPHKMLWMHMQQITATQEGLPFNSELHIIHA